MTPSRRLFVLLGAYEDLTGRESGALRRGDVARAISLENRKLRLAQSMATVRRDATLSTDEAGDYVRRVRRLESLEQDNLAFLREETNRSRDALSRINQAAGRMRNVRRGYAGAGAPGSVPVLGRA